MLGFRSFHFVSCEVSLKKTHDKKMTPNRSQKIKGQKLLENKLQKGYNHKKRKLF